MGGMKRESKSFISRTTHLFPPLMLFTSCKPGKDQLLHPDWMEVWIRFDLSTIHLGIVSTSHPQRTQLEGMCNWTQPSGT